MNEADLWRIHHILGAAHEAQSFIRGETRESLERDRKLVLVLAMEVTIIGEAAGRITKETQVAHPEIPWGSIIGMRNIIVHAYFRIDLDLLWETVTVSFPELMSQLESLIPPENN